MKDFKEPYVFSSRRERPVEERKEEIVVEEVVPKSYTKHTTERLNMRKTPGGEVVKILPANAAVEVIEEKDGWAHLENGYYVMSKYIK